MAVVLALERWVPATNERNAVRQSDGQVTRAMLPEAEGGIDKVRARLVDAGPCRQDQPFDLAIKGQERKRPIVTSLVAM